MSNNKSNNGISNRPAQPVETLSLLQGMSVPGLDMVKGVVRFIGDEKAYIHVLRTFTVNTRKLLTFFDSMSSDDIAEYEIKIHSLRGSSASISADSAASMATELEKAAIAKDWEYISTHNKRFTDDIRELLSGIDDLLTTIDSLNQKEKKDKPDAAALQRLQIACDNYDMGAVDTVMEELTAYSYESDNGLVEWLNENIELMNFSEVVERLSGL